MGAVYLDLKKAFNKILCWRLIWKIGKFGLIGGRLLEWIEGYQQYREIFNVAKGNQWCLAGIGVGTNNIWNYVNDMKEEIDSYLNKSLCRWCETDEENW